MHRSLGDRPPSMTEAVSTASVTMLLAVQVAAVHPVPNRHTDR
ncbi:hypothetical protein ACFY94_02490 [Streptomyces griseorubiginosus]